MAWALSSPFLSHGEAKSLIQGHAGNSGKPRINPGQLDSGVPHRWCRPVSQEQETKHRDLRSHKGRDGCCHPDPRGERSELGRAGPHTGTVRGKVSTGIGRLQGLAAQRATVMGR